MRTSVGRSQEVANNDVGFFVSETTATWASRSSGGSGLSATSDFPLAEASAQGDFSATARNVASKVIFATALLLGLGAEKADAGFITSASGYGAMAELGNTLTSERPYDPNRGFIGAIFVTDSQGNVVNHATVTVVTPTLGFVAGHTLLNYQGDEYTKTLVFSTNVLTDPTASQTVSSVEFHPDYNYAGNRLSPDIAAVHFDSVADIYGGNFAWKVADEPSPLDSRVTLAGYDLSGNLTDGMETTWTGQAHGVYGEITNSGYNSKIDPKYITSYRYVKGLTTGPLDGVIAKYGSGGAAVNADGTLAGIMVANNGIGGDVAWSYSVKPDDWFRTEIANSLLSTVPEPQPGILMVVGGAAIAAAAGLASVKRTKA